MSDLLAASPPQNYSFYDLIVTKARGKSGPLFHFDVHDDVRLVNDARVEKDESHPGKVVERHWYEKNKHIFPASRWEVVRRRTRCLAFTVKLPFPLTVVLFVRHAVRPERHARQVHDPRRRSQQEVASARSRQT